MQQIVSSSAGIKVIDVPAPVLRPGQALVRVERSCVSPGSELAASASHQESLVAKLRSRPEKALAVWKLFRNSGIDAVKERIAQQTDEYRSMGYSVAGVVVDPGDTDLRAGERVACAGTGFAVHAELVAVPRNLACRIPDAVSFDAAASVALGAIALQGVRRADLDAGSAVGVIGLGAIGQLTVRLAAGAGCDVWVSDLDEGRVAMALRASPRVRRLPKDGIPSMGPGVAEVGGLDAVIVTAASSAPGLLDLAARLCRIRGRMVVVGDVPVQAERELMYAKELEIRLACSYGPGRYDASYEIEGVDYPAGWVRWTANRNMQAYLDAIAAAPAMYEPLWPAATPAADAPALFAALRGRGELFGLLRYPDRPSAERAVTSARRGAAKPKDGRVRVAVVGAGEFARLMHFPLLAKDPGVALAAIATRTALTGERLQRQYEVPHLTTNVDDVLADDAVDAIVVTLRHHEHARVVRDALRAGKHVFVEKPLALTDAEVDEIVEAHAAAPDRVLMVGFNRRFAPSVALLRDAAAGAGSGECVLHYRFAAGKLPPTHWTNGPEGGGRLVGEGCHALDLVEHLLGAIEVAEIRPIGRPPQHGHAADAAVLIQSAAGVAHLSYTASAPPSAGKERLELCAGGMTAVVEDYKRAEAGSRTWSAARADKGHAAGLAAWVQAIRAGGAPPIAPESLVRTARLAIALQAAADRGLPARWTPDGR